MRLFRPRSFRPATFLLVALAWSRLAFGGEIHEAAKNGDLEKVKTLLADNPRLVSSKDDNYGWTPLHWAAYMGRTAVVDLLLSSKADVNAAANNGWTPLHLALANARKDAAELLIQHGGQDSVMPEASATSGTATNDAGLLSAARILNEAAARLGSENVRILGKNSTTPVRVDRQHPVRLQLVAPAPPFPNMSPDVGANVKVYGSWMKSEATTISIDPQMGPSLGPGQLQFRGTVSVGPHVVVFLRGEIDSVASNGGVCADGTVALVDGMGYQLDNRVWKPAHLSLPTQPAHPVSQEPK